VEILRKWYEATDKIGTFVRELLLDCSKAFDLINHEILIDKLVKMNLQPHLVRWMAAFLLDREQRVRIGNVVSGPGYPNGGVPQGTLCGPKNFLVHINDLRTPRPIYKYVDDSTIFEICNHNSDSILQHSADITEQWSNDHDMLINTSKTKEMAIYFCKGKTHIESLPHININGSDIDRVTQVKVLRVIISSDLSWNEHVDGIVSKTSKKVYMVYQLKRAGITQHDLLRVYLSVIRSVLEYACPAWHTNLPKYLSDTIETIQRICLRTIYPGYAYNDVLQMVNIPTLNNRRNDLCKAYFNQMRHDNHKLHKLLPSARDVPYSLRSCNELPIPRARTNRYNNSLIPWGLLNCQDA